MKGYHRPETNETSFSKASIGPSMSSARRRVDVLGGSKFVMGTYSARPPFTIPVGVQQFCDDVSLNPAEIWKKWSDPKVQWYEAPRGSFIYWNQDNRHWWICDAAGRVMYKARDNQGKLESVQSWLSCEGLYSQPPARVQISADVDHPQHSAQLTCSFE